MPIGLSDKEIEKLLDKNKLKIHISQEPLKKMEISHQEIITGFNSAGRPEGIWYSYGGSWLRFLTQNSSEIRDEFRPCCLMYNVVLNKKIIKLNTSKKLNNFDKKFKSYWRNIDDIQRGSSYMKNLPYKPIGRSMGIKRDANKLIKEGVILTSAESVKEHFEDIYNTIISKKDIDYYKYPRWDLIAQKYNGVEMIPYIKSFTNKRFWYWTVDVASGCVWNPDGVKEIKLLARKVGEEWILTDYGQKIFNK